GPDDAGAGCDAAPQGSGNRHRLRLSDGGALPSGAPGLYDRTSPAAAPRGGGALRQAADPQHHGHCRRWNEGLARPGAIRSHHRDGGCVRLARNFARPAGDWRHHGIAARAGTGRSGTDQASAQRSGDRNGEIMRRAFRAFAAGPAPGTGPSMTVRLLTLILLLGLAGCANSTYDPSIMQTETAPAPTTPPVVPPGA